MYNLQYCYDEFLTYKRTYCEERTILNYDTNIRRLFEIMALKMTMDIQKLDFSILSGYLAYLRTQDIRNTTIKTYIRDIKVFYKYLYDNGYHDVDYTRKLQLPKASNRLKMPLTNAEVRTIDTYLESRGRIGIRNYIIIHLMLDSGLRLSEVCNLKSNEIDLNLNYVQIIDSKNNKNRVVPLPGYVKDKMLIYNAMKNEKNATNEYYLLDKSMREKVTLNCIKLMLAKLKKAVNIDRIHAHLLRHTFATSYTYFGGNMEFLRVLMGHSDYNVTRNYIHLSSQCMVISYDIYKIDSKYFERRV